jgi:hypothetical protein
MRKIIKGKIYDTEKAQLIAHDRYWDGKSWERDGRNSYLYRTSKGNFFLYQSTKVEGERDGIWPITKKEAIEWYGDLEVQEMEYEEAFGEPPEEA